ncbi:MAG: dihydroorotase [Oscillospiraceae bacterium]|nr:dihydroorotase [Oscillospiraceae bacterium]
MMLLFTGGTVWRGGQFREEPLAVSGANIVPCPAGTNGASVIRVPGCVIVPGFTDVHVHFRQPGFAYKETIYSGTFAAAAGGYTTVCAMPNLNPVPDTPEHLQAELDLIQRDAIIRVWPYGSITRGEQGAELSDFAALAPYVAGFSDDGKGVQSREVMREAMEHAKGVEKPIVAHCEDESLLRKDWAIHDGAFARRNGFPGNASESEWRQVERDLELVRETGCQYHVCHVSTKESVALIRDAKRDGLPVSCETAPHYLALTDEELSDDGRFKMNPPIRSADDRDALLAGLLDGTIDCIATDHAPHSAGEKSRGLRGSLNGVVGLETAFPVLYTNLVETGLVPLETLLRALCVRPREIFGFAACTLSPGEAADFTILDLNRPHTVNSTRFHSLGRATPFDGWGVSAAVAMTVCGGKIVYHNLPYREGIS